MPKLVVVSVYYLFKSCNGKLSHVTMSYRMIHLASSIIQVYNTLSVDQVMFCTSVLPGDPPSCGGKSTAWIGPSAQGWLCGQRTALCDLSVLSWCVEQKEQMCWNLQFGNEWISVPGSTNATVIRFRISLGVIPAASVWC